MKKTIDYHFYASFAICVFAAAATAYFAFRFAAGIILPFLIAYLIALIAVPLAKRFTGGRSKHQRLWAAAFFLIIVSVGGTLIYLFASRMIYEAGKLLEKLSTGEGNLSRVIYDVFDTIDNIGAKIPFLNKLKNSKSTENIAGYIEEMLVNMISRAVSELGGRIPSVIGNMISALPSILISLLVTLTAGFYFCLDFEKVNSFILSSMPKKWRENIPKVKKSVLLTVVKYIKAYLLILFITSIELYLGFTIIGIDYALLLATLIAIIDLLPVLGVGTVLIPWSIIAFIMRDVRRGLGLLILYGAVTVIRQLIEPKIVGKSLGLHPLATLISMYSGYKLLGITGMIAGPIILTIAVTTARAVRGNKTDGKDQTDTSA